MGYGALLVAGAFLFLFTTGLAGRGAVGGDVFVVGSIGFVVDRGVDLHLHADLPDDGQRADHPGGLLFARRRSSAKLFSERLWGIGCVTGGVRCGVAWNSLFLAVVVGVLTTLIGLVFALVVTRTGFRYGQDPAGADGAADHHAALRHRACHHPAVRPFRGGDPGIRRTVRHAADALGLRPCRGC